MIQQKEAGDVHTGALEHPYGRGVNFQIKTDELEKIVERIKAAGHPLKRGIEESWRKCGTISASRYRIRGEKEIHVLDPDGYFLRFSQLVE